MKKCYTEQKSANRHPKKYNFNRIETMPVSFRRKEEIFAIDSKDYDERMAEKAKKEEYRSNPNYLK